MSTPDWLYFFERMYPSANMVLVPGKRPVLIDTGFGSDVPETERLLRGAGVPPQSLHLIVNTHYHTDHVGGNYALQQRYHVPVAAHHWDAALVNQRDPEICSATWLGQPIEPYQVDQPLTEGDEIDTGNVVLRVLHTPGHTLGHIALYAPEQQVLICGDVVHRDDVAWIGMFREGAGALQRLCETLDRVARLPLHWACSGHGSAMEQPLAAIDAARRRYDKWLAEPEKLGWHACKRIFAFALMLFNGMDASEIAPYLLRAAWYHDYTHHIFHVDPVEFIHPLLQEMQRSGAAGWKNGRLMPLTPYNPMPIDWASGSTTVKNWPKIDVLPSLI